MQRANEGPTDTEATGKNQASAQLMTNAGLAGGADSGDLKHGIEAAGLSQFVVFSVNEQDYCVDIMLVREIRAWDGASSVPNAPDYVRGVINLRGQIVPVVDLGARFGLRAPDNQNGAVIIIVMIDQNLHGLLVDSVSDILSVEPEDIAPAPDIASDTEVGGFLSGIVKRDEAIVAAIDPERLTA